MLSCFRFWGLYLSMRRYHKLVQLSCAKKGRFISLNFIGVFVCEGWKTQFSTFQQSIVPTILCSWCYFKVQCINTSCLVMVSSHHVSFFSNFPFCWLLLCFNHKVDAQHWMSSVSIFPNVFYISSISWNNFIYCIVYLPR